MAWLKFLQAMFDRHRKRAGQTANQQSTWMGHPSIMNINKLCNFKRNADETSQHNSHTYTHIVRSSAVCFAQLIIDRAPSQKLIRFKRYNTKNQTCSLKKFKIERKLIKTIF